MFISDSHELIVLLPQKCASKTLQIRFDALRSPDSLDSGVVYEEELGRYISKHVTLKDALKLQAYKNREGYRKACFVRNPYDRVYSWFTWIRRSLDKPGPEAVGGHKEIDRIEHIRRSRARKLEKMEELDYDFNRYLKRNEKSFKPANRFTHHKKKCLVDFIGYQEDFERDYNGMVKLFQLPVSSVGDGNVVSGKRCAKKPPEMVASDYQYAEFFDRESIRIINRRFKLDFKYFDYPMLKPRHFPVTLG
ncbi:MAG TPA: hypothetical protein DCY55_03355 [Gammaproteobacteria bacterium]|nr:hypothetical protein [Gammaproteobacteria bacterium]